MNEYFLFIMRTSCLLTGKALINVWYFSFVVHPLQFNNECLLFSVVGNLSNDFMENSSNILVFISL